MAETLSNTRRPSATGPDILSDEDARNAERRFNRKVVLGLVVSLLLIVGSFAAVVVAFTMNNRSDEEVIATYQVIDRLSTVEILVERVGTISRGYILSPDEKRLKNYRSSRAELAETLSATRTRLEQDPAQARRLSEFRALVSDQMGAVDAIMRAAATGRSDEAMRLLKIDLASYNLLELRTKADEIREAELTLLESRRTDERRATFIAETVMAITLFLILLSAAAIILVVRRFIHDIGRSREKLSQMNSHLESAVVERTQDLTRANDEIQRFAYIVSHDLRSPLVNMMGFTSELERAAEAITRQFRTIEEKAPELVDKDARFAIEEDLPESIGFVKSSTRKMDRLINAILGLSRQGRRVLVPEPLDMDAMFEDIAGNLSSQTDAKGASIEIVTPLPRLRQDRLAVEQVFTNLVENAVKYLDPKRAGHITVRGKRRCSRAIFEVRDNGRGISKDDHERIFELFRRAGTQDQQGEGIGLANVRGVVQRLGGTIDVISELGEGSTFVVEIPSHASNDDDGKEGE